MSADSAAPVLRKIALEAGNPSYTLKNGALVEKENKRLVVASSETRSIPDGISVIAFAAFQGQTGLESIDVPESVTTIGAYAFEGCTHLKSIRLPGRMEGLYAGAFRHCRSLEEAVIPEGIKVIPRDLFCGCRLLHTVVIPNTVEAIERSKNFLSGGAFHECKSLREIHLPDGLTTIGQFAFSGSGLTEVRIPDGVTSIERGAFRYCKDLKRVSIPHGLDISDSACEDDVEIIERD